MKKVLVVASLLALAISTQADKNVFWYKLGTKNYNIADAAGPNIQGTVTKWSGPIHSSTIRGSAGNQDPNVNLGNGLDNAQARTFVTWFADLCSLTTTGTVTSAKLRGEYRDAFSGNAFCNAGPLNPRVGVVNFAGQLAAVGATPSTYPETAIWLDPLNPLACTMAYEDPAAESGFRAETTLALTAPAGNDGTNTKLEGQFFEMDVTKQVKYILDQATPLQLGIAAIVCANDGNTGKVNTYAYEDCPASVPARTVDAWTTDGNTWHLVVDVAGGTLVKKSTAAEKVVSVSNAVDIVVAPSPANPSTTVSFNTGNNKNGVVKIFSAEGKLIFSKNVSGRDSFVWNGQGMNSGVYFCRLETGKTTMTRSIVLMK